MSVARSIADAYVALISALASPPAKTVYRKADVIFKTDTLPCCVVTIKTLGPDGWATLGDGTSADRGTMGKQYAVGFAIYSESEGQLQTDIDSTPQLVQDIERLVGQPTVAAAGTMWDTELVSHAEFERQFQTGWEIDRCGVLVRSSEPRV